MNVKYPKSREAKQKERLFVFYMCFLLFYMYDFVVQNWRELVKLLNFGVNYCSMCTNLKIIKSTAKRYRPQFSRGELAVPCGHCAECISGAQDDWFLRTWQEIKTYTVDKGKVVFATFTYDNEHLPIFTDVDIDYDTGECKVYQIPVFNKLHKDRYLNSLLKYFETRGITGENSLGVRFIWCSEYGESDFGTHRPHYHVLLFFPGKAIDEDVLGFDPANEMEWKKFLSSYWSYGMCRWSKQEDGGIFVNSEFAARYVTKYVVKDIEFYDQPQLNEYLFDGRGKRIPYRYDKIKRFLPKHWQSKSFGQDLVQYCNNDAVFKDGIDFRFVDDMKRGKDHKYRVPRYIERKLLYEFDEYGSEVLNERGKRVKGELYGFDSKLDELVKHNADYIHEASKNYITSAIYLGCEPTEEPMAYIKTLLSNKSLLYYSAWQLSFSGTCFCDFDLDCGLIVDLVSGSDKQFVDFCRELYNKRILGYDGYEPFFEDGFIDHVKYYLPEQHPMFAKFSQFNALMMEVRNGKRQDAFNSYMRERKERKRLKLNVS